MAGKEKPKLSNLLPGTPVNSLACMNDDAWRKEKRAVTKAYLEDNIKREVTKATLEDNTKHEVTKEIFEINIWQLVWIVKQKTKRGVFVQFASVVKKQNVSVLSLMK